MVRLLIVDDARVFLRDQVGYMPNPLNLLWERMACHFDSVRVSAPTRVDDTTQLNARDYPMANSPSVRCLPRPYFAIDSVARAHRLFVPTLRALSEAIQEADIVFLRLPSAVGPFAYTLTRRSQKRIAVQIKGDWTAIAANSYTGARRQVVHSLALLSSSFDRFVARRHLCFVHSDQHKQRYGCGNPNTYKISVSLVPRTLISARQDTCQQPHVTALCVGRLVPFKGVENLLLALKHLGGSVSLRLVGDGPEHDRLVREVAFMGLDARVVFAGHKPFGDALFEEYRRADIFVLPSLSEGRPKVLFEAMAFGLPIVATKVGGVPEMIDDMQTGLLVPPVDPTALAAAISEIVDNRQLRRRLIRQAREVVKRQTIETTAEFMSLRLLTAT